MSFHLNFLSNVRVEIFQTLEFLCMTSLYWTSLALKNIYK